jgi:hypothetical protein
MRNFLVLVFFGVALVGCAHDARLYPANDLAAPGGVLTVRFTSTDSGHGEIEITMPDQDLLKGKYSIVRGVAVGFGRVYGAVYGIGGSASVSGSSQSHDVVPAGSSGMAALFGPKGTTMECEFLRDNVSGHGNGACKTSKGALYRLQY